MIARLQKCLCVLSALTVTFVLVLCCAFGRYPHFAVFAASHRSIKQAQIDHVMISGLAYLGSGRARAQLRARDKMQWRPAIHPAFSVVISTRHRALPYINVLVASLLQSDSVRFLQRHVQIHIVRTQQVAGAHDSLDQLRAQLPGLLHEHTAPEAVDQCARLRGKSGRQWRLWECQLAVDYLHSCASASRCAWPPALSFPMLSLCALCAHLLGCLQRIKTAYAKYIHADANARRYACRRMRGGALYLRKTQS